MPCQQAAGAAQAACPGSPLPPPPAPPPCSFGIVLWELLTGRIPYSDMTPLQAAVGVVQKGLRPPIPPNCPPPLSDIMRLCWQRDPNVRPSFEQVCARRLCCAERAGTLLPPGYAGCALLRGRLPLPSQPRLTSASPLPPTLCPRSSR